MGKGAKTKAGHPCRVKVVHFFAPILENMPARRSGCCWVCAGVWEFLRRRDFGGLQRCCRMEAARLTEPGQSLSCSPAEWDVRRNLFSFSPLVQWEDNFLAGKSRPSLARVFIVTAAPGM